MAVRRRNRTILWTAAGALVTAAIPIAAAAADQPFGAQPAPGVQQADPGPVELSASAREQIALLDSPDYAVRTKATAALLGDERVTLRQLEEVLKSGTLSLEARTRLMQVARQRFFKSPRAAMGVQFGGNLRDRVIVGKTFDRFDSSRMLEEMDMIVEAGGHRLEGVDARPMLQSIIIAHDPGDTLSLVVRRGAEKIHVDLPLGRFADLDNAFLPEDRLARAWLLRTEGYSTGQPPISFNVAADQWKPDVEALRRIELAALRRRDAQENQPLVIGGGMPRGAAGGFADEPRFQAQNVVINGRVQVIQMPVQRAWDEPPEWSMPPMTPAEEIAVLVQSKAKIVAELKSYPDPDKLAPNDPIRSHILERQRLIEQIDKQRMAVQAEVDDGRQGRQSAAESTDGPDR